MDNVTNKSKVFWNILGGICNAFSSMVLLIAVNRTLGADSGGIFSLAFAVGQMLIIIATLEVRNFQATDLTERYSFSSYFVLRIFCCIVMLGVTCFYIVILEYKGEKAVIVFLLCLYKAIEAFSDVFEGLYQQHDRIDLSGKSMTIRVILSTIVFIGSLVFTRNLIWSTVCLVVSSFVASVCYNYLKCKKFAKIFLKIKIKDPFEIVKGCIPIALGAFMIMYIGNSPKYAIDKYLNLELQNAFGIIFMPAFAINLFSLFFFRPLLTSIAISWMDRNLKRFIRIIEKSVVWMLIVTIVFVVGAYFLGIPILSFLYGINLEEYKMELILIMIGGGLNALMTIFRFSLTAIREQNISLLAFVLSFLFSILVTPLLVKSWGITGASWSYIVAMLIMNVVFAIIMIYKIFQRFGLKDNRGRNL